VTELGLAAAVLVASLTLTYLFCLRPMRRGHCAVGARRGHGRHLSDTADRDAEIAGLRQEVSALRDAHAAGRFGSSGR
jgi:hypothetical protein